jgi:hypothetical protein
LTVFRVRILRDPGPSVPEPIIVIAVLHIMPALALAVGAPPAPSDAVPKACKDARTAYESLSLERAVEMADSGLKGDRPALACYEVKALALLVLGQMDGARATLEALFSRDPDYKIEDPSLSPALKDAIQQVRENTRSLTAQVRARWVIRESLRLDVLLEGGLRDATKIRYAAETTPSPGRHSGEIRLFGRVATATIAVLTPDDVSKVKISGTVLNDADRVIAQFTRELPIPDRPLAPEPEKVIVEVEGGGGIGWPVWLAIGIGAVGAGVAIAILAQPHLPNTSGTVGISQVPGQ